MMSWKHALLGATLAVAPDLLLFTFGWRQDWLPEADWRVRLHRAIHSPRGLVTVAAVAWGSHLVADWYSPHRSAPAAPTAQEDAPRALRLVVAPPRPHRRSRPPPPALTLVGPIRQERPHG